MPSRHLRILRLILIGYTGDLYGASVSLAFTRWLRPSRVFDSLDELIATVEGNIEDIRHNGRSGGEHP